MDGTCLQGLTEEDFQYEENEAGVVPIEYKVLIKPDEVDPFTAGGLTVPDTVLEKEMIAQMKGTIIAVGGSAFEGMKPPLPKVGDKVFFAKFQGFLLRRGRKEYRVVNDKDIAALIFDDSVVEREQRSPRSLSGTTELT